ncbi:MAG TPA: FAD-binding oxidoreductase [Pseudomonadales bacterium]|nr:FAD-binding oxidoreductase [Pseudomonadales bacterium]
MRRWNGWGDDGVTVALNPLAQQFLHDLLGPGAPQPDVELAVQTSAIGPSRLPAEPPATVSLQPEERIKHAVGQSWPDWLKMKFGKIGRVPDGVAYPESTEQVRTLLQWAAKHQVVVIPYGGGTSVVGHLTCPDTEKPILSLSLERMTRLLSLDTRSQLATFGAGANGYAVEAQLRAQGYTLGHFPQSFEYSTVGGWIVTRSSGQQSLRYGRIEQLFAGGRVETMVGSLSIPTFPASAAGTDLREWVLGSEGRLGVVTEAVMRVTPVAEHESFHALFFPSWDHAERAVRELVQSKLPLSMLRLSNPMETFTNLKLAGHANLISLLERYLQFRGVGEGKCMLMLGVTGFKNTAKSALKEAITRCRQQGGVYIGTAMGNKWAENRFRGPYLRNSLWQLGYASDTVETAADWPAVTSTMQAVESAARDALAEMGVKLHAFTHLSHLYPQGASIYTTFVYPLAQGYEANLLRWQALKKAASEAMTHAGTTISHQHGVGRDHAPYLLAEKGPLGVAVMRKLFKQFDPEGLMNPGCLVADE